MTRMTQWIQLYLLFYLQINSPILSVVKCKWQFSITNYTPFVMKLKVLFRQIEMSMIFSVYLPQSDEYSERLIEGTENLKRLARFVNDWIVQRLFWSFHSNYTLFFPLFCLFPYILCMTKNSDKIYKMSD